MNAETGKYLMLGGALLLLLGALLYFFHDWLQWVGRLPGDIRMERAGFRLYIPITTMLIFSAGITVITALIRRLLS